MSIHIFARSDEAENGGAGDATMMSYIPMGGRKRLGPRISVQPLLVYKLQWWVLVIDDIYIGF